MLKDFIIVEKLAGQYGRSDTRVVRGTDVTITKGHLQIWNTLRDGALGRRPVFSAPVDRVITLKQQSLRESHQLPTPHQSDLGRRDGHIADISHVA